MKTIRKTVRVGSVPVSRYGYPLACSDLLVTIEYGPDRLNPGKPGPVLSIVGEYGDGGGQCISALDEVVTFALGWSRELAQRFKDAWQRWHLNGMRAGCEHQRAAGWKTCPGHHSSEPFHVEVVDLLEKRGDEARQLKKDADTLRRVCEQHDVQGDTRAAMIDLAATLDDASAAIKGQLPKLGEGPRKVYGAQRPTIEYRCGQNERLPMPCGAPDALSKPCPECGYKFGTAWLFEEVPADVVEFLDSLPSGYHPASVSHPASAKAEKRKHGRR